MAGSGTVTFKAEVIGNQRLNTTGYTLSVTKTGSWPSTNYRITKVTFQRTFRNTGTYGFQIRANGSNGTIISQSLDAQTGGGVASTSTISSDYYVNSYFSNITSLHLYGVGGTSGELKSGSYIILTVTWQESDVVTKISGITSSVACGGSVTVTGTSAYATYKHTLQISFGDKKSSILTIAKGSTAVSGTISIDASYADEIPNATSGTATATLKTYDTENSDKLIGTATKSFKITVPNSAAYNPSVSIDAATVKNTATLGGVEYILQNHSFLQIQATGTAKHSATVKSLSFSGDSLAVSYSGSASTLTKTPASGPFSAAGSLTYTVKVTDSRGRTASATTTVTVTAYSLPRYTRLTAERCDVDGNITPTGTGLSIGSTVSFTAFDGKNALHMTVERREADGQYPVTPMYDGGYVNPLQPAIADYPFDADKKYYVRVTFYDDVTAATPVELDLPTAYILMRWEPHNSSFGFGCYPTGKKRVEIADDWGLYHGGVDVLDAPTLWENTSAWYTGSQTITDLEDWLIVEAVTDAGPSGLLTNDGTGVFRGVCFGWTYGGFTAYFAAITAGSGTASMGHFEQLSIKPSGISTIGTQCGLVRLIGIKRK